MKSRAFKYLILISHHHFPWVLSPNIINLLIVPHLVQIVLCLHAFSHHIFSKLNALCTCLWLTDFTTSFQNLLNFYHLLGTMLDTWLYIGKEINYNLEPFGIFSSYLRFSKTLYLNSHLGLNAPMSMASYTSYTQICYLGVLTLDWMFFEDRISWFITHFHTPSPVPYLTYSGCSVIVELFLNWRKIMWSLPLMNSHDL